MAREGGPGNAGEGERAGERGLVKKGRRNG